MTWTSLDIWIVVIGILAASSCALIGNFLILRRMSIMGDAISHAVLPGLAAAFLLTHSRSNLVMFIGAAIVGVLTALLTEWIHSFGKVEQNASMGVVFTILFAIGLLLIVQAADSVDLDPGCVLYGSIEFTPLDTTTFFGLTIPRAVVTLSITFLINISAVILLFKEFRISSFDPSLATTMGVNAKLMHLLLMTLVAITTVAAFESVGSILVVAMLIVPGAAAHLLTDRLAPMLFASVIFASLSAFFGHMAAIIVPGWFGLESTNSAGSIAVIAGLMFLIVLVLAPQHGIFSRYFLKRKLLAQ